MTRHLARVAVHLAVGAAATLAAAAASLTVHDLVARRVLWVAVAVIVAAGGGVAWAIRGGGRRTPGAPMAVGVINTAK